MIVATRNRRGLPYSQKWFAHRAESEGNGRPVALLINGLGTGGAERAVALAIKGLRARGHDIRVLCLERLPPERTIDVEAPIVTLSGMWSDCGPARKLAALPILAARLAAYVRRQGVETVMSHLFRANFVNVLSRSVFGAAHRVVLVNHTRVSRLKGEGAAGRVNSLLCRLLYPKADIVASVSKGAARECARILGIRPGHSISLFDPVDTDRAAAAAEGTTVVEALVVIGRLVPLKRVGDLIEAFSRLAPAYPRLELRIVGEGPARRDLQRRASASCAMNRIRFFGRLRDPFPVLAGCRAMVCTSETEGFGIAIVEALSAGVPVISSDCAYGPREILAPNTDPFRFLNPPATYEVAEYGILYPVGSIDTLEMAIHRILDDDALRATYAHRGPIRAAFFSAERSTSEYENLLFAQ